MTSTSVMLRALLLLILHISVSALYSEEKQEKLNSALREAITQNSNLFPSSILNRTYPELPQTSMMRSLCSDINLDDPERNRLGCCQPTKMKVLYNVQLRSRKFEMMYKTNQSATFFTLPILNAMRYVPFFHCCCLFPFNYELFITFFNFYGFIE